MTTDPIADMLTRIRNANTASHRTVEMASSKMKANLARVLKDEGFIADYEVKGESPRQTLSITLKARKGTGIRALNGLERVSRPGLRVYSGVDEIGEVMGGFGVAVISTSKGLMTQRQARQQKLGGEVVAKVW